MPSPKARPGNYLTKIDQTVPRLHKEVKNLIHYGQSRSDILREVRIAMNEAESE